MQKLALLLAFAALAMYGQEDGFTGRPVVRVDDDGSAVKRTELSEAAGEKYECRIVKKGRKFVWASRGNRELIRSDAGDYVYYVSPEGTGYVKVFTGTQGGSYDYIEHLTTELRTVTYWGQRAR